MRSVETTDGPIEILRRDGKPAAGSIVLLHGIQGTASAWDGVAGLIETDRTLVRPNLRGRAGSLSPDSADAYSLHSFSEDLRAVLSSVEGPTLLIGWSMGTLVALTYIRAYGTSGIDGLILASGTPCPGNEAVWFAGRTTAEIEQEAAERARRLNLTAVARPAAVAGAWASVRDADLRDVLPDIRIPTFVLHGAQDDQCPLAHAEAMAAAIPGAKLDVWDGMGHNLMAEDPIRFAATIQTLARSVQPTDMCSANQ